METLSRPWGEMHIHVTGPAHGPLVLFANSLGTDLRVWDPLLPHLPAGLRVARFDKPGHGLSDLAETVTIDGLAEDAAALIEALGGGSPAVVVGLSIGGLIAQALAAKRPGLVRAMVLSNTAACIATPEIWAQRIAAVEADGMVSLTDATMERWFTETFRATPALAVWRNMLQRTPAAGYAACCRAIAATDLTASTTGLRLPTLAIAGAHDGSIPPDVVEATARLIPGAEFHVLPDAGHIPGVVTPAAVAALLTPFLEAHAHDR